MTTIQFSALKANDSYENIKEELEFWIDDEMTRTRILDEVADKIFLKCLNECGII